MIDPPRIPIFASLISTGSDSASSVMNSATVKPIPASPAPPTSWPQRSVSGTCPMPLRSANQVPAVTPTSLPIVRPTMTPQVIGDVNAAARDDVVSTTPALARTKTGTMT